MVEPVDAVFRFEPFRYDPVQRVLFRDSEVVPLQPKTIDLLELLLQRRGEAIPKDELIKALWPDCVVEEIGLARNVSLLRKALGENAESYIETVPKRGYRFAAGAQCSPAGEQRALGVRTWLFAVSAVLTLSVLTYWQFYRSSRFFLSDSGTPTIAVIPFDRLTSDVDPAFGQGLSDALAAELSKLRRIQVTSPSTVRRYRRVGIPIVVMDRLLGLDAVIEGTAQRFGPTVRVSVRLSDAHSGRLIWADSYDIAADEPASAGMKVAQAVITQVGARLTQR